MQNDLPQHPFIDALAGGEWDYTALEFCQRVRDCRSFAGTLGLSYRDDRASAVHEMRRSNIKQLDELPFPHRRTLDMGLYHDNPGDIPSRGCPYTCDFCVWPQVVYEDNKYRTRSAKNMADEIEAMSATTRIRTARTMSTTTRGTSTTAPGRVRGRTDTPRARAHPLGRHVPRRHAQKTLVGDMRETMR